jgi:hypothetical protein
LVRGEPYNWKGQEERLVYMGAKAYGEFGQDVWHRFALVESPDEVWCEVKDYQLDDFERTV